MNKEINTRIYAQGSIEEFRNDGDEHDNAYLPARSLAFMPKDPNGIFVLPDHPDVRTYFDQLSKVYQEMGVIPPRINRDPMIPNTDYLLDVCIQQNLEYLETNLDRDRSYSVFPYATTEATLAWIHDLQDRGFQIESALPQRTYYEDLSSPAHRGGWGRNVRTPESMSFSEKNGIPYPHAFVGTGLEEVIQAYRFLSDRTGSPDAFFKPVFSAGGYTLARITSEEDLVSHFKSLKAQGALDILGRETPVEIQAEIKNIVGLCSLQYEDDKIVSPNILTRQLVNGTNWTGNVFNTDMDPALIMQAQDIFRKFANGIKEYTGKRLRGLGGLDMAIVPSDSQQRLQVIEHNGQRITGGHPAIALAQGFGVESAYMTQKSPADPQCDLATLYDLLKVSHLQYDPRQQRGIFPIVWMKGSGMLWVAGRDQVEMQQLLDVTYNQLSKENLIA